MAQPRIGRLVITRRFYESFLLGIGSWVDKNLPARDLFLNPVRITILPGDSRYSNQVSVRTEADKRIKIVRAELDHRVRTVNTESTDQTEEINLEGIFMDIVRSELPEPEFFRLLQIAQYELNEMRRC